MANHANSRSRATRVITPSSNGWARLAGEVIRDGGLVAFPTETVYGLGANGLDSGAVQRIFEAKQRPSNNPLILHVAHPGAVDALVSERPSWTQTLIDNFWAGPMTLVLPRSAAVPDTVTGGGDTVAVRMPSHPVALELIDAAGVPLAAPSANLYQKTSPTTAQHVLNQLQGRVDLVIDDDRTTLGIESTVIDCTRSVPRVLRHGSLTLEELREVLPQTEDGEGVASGDQPLLSPGTVRKHYAPDRELLVLSGSVSGLSAALPDYVQGEYTLLIVDEMRHIVPDTRTESVASIGSWHSPAAVAANLYYHLQSGSRLPHRIVLTAPSPEGVGRAVHDRLRRAASRWMDVD